jgi:hypothetical protein
MGGGGGGGGGDEDEEKVGLFRAAPQLPQNFAFGSICEPQFPQYGIFESQIVDVLQLLINLTILSIYVH